MLDPVTEKFVLHWGEMGTRWGINRSVAQVHALLFISPEPLSAEALSDILGIARSNVSTSIKELQSWGIIRTVPQLGDRREHYESIHDVWELFRIVLQERKRREIDPTLSVLRECVMEARSGHANAIKVARFEELLNFFETTTNWYSYINRLPRSMLMRLLSMTDRLASLLEKK